MSETLTKAYDFNVLTKVENILPDFLVVSMCKTLLLDIVKMDGMYGHTWEMCSIVNEKHNEIFERLSTKPTYIYFAIRCNFPNKHRRILLSLLETYHLQIEPDYVGCNLDYFFGHKGFTPKDVFWSVRKRFIEQIIKLHTV